MDIVKLNTFEQVKRAFNDVKTTFPNLSKSEGLNDYLKKLFKFGNVYASYDFENNKYCGIAAVYMNDIENKCAYISLIGISKNYRKQHLGTRLILHCEAEARNSNMTCIKLEVKKDNDIAIKFYLKNGYQFTEQETETSLYLIKNIEG